MRGVWVAAALIVLPFAAGSAPTEPSWWETTLLDADRDGLDDALAPLLAGSTPLRVIVDYADMPTATQRAAVERAGFAIAFAPENFPLLVVDAEPVRARELLALPGVVFVEVNDVIERQLKESVPLIGAPRVWREYGATGQGVVVAVLDDGAYQRHPDFTGKIVASFNAATPPSPLGSAGQDVIIPAGEAGHGTHVAGTVVGEGDESGGVYKGVAPAARFVDVQVFRGPNATNSDIVLRGLDWVVSKRDALGIRIASMSLGGRPSDGKDALSRSVDIAVDKGLVVVAAAGNQGPGKSTVASPGAAEKAITVGAVDKQKRTASFSSRGPTLDGRTKPEIAAPGVAITSTIPPASTTTISGFLSGSRTMYYGSLSGTSMAAPHVSGVVALMLETNPTLTPQDVKRILLVTSQDIGPTGRDNETGYGFVNAIAAVQIAQDPALLNLPEFAAILGTLPEPEPEGIIDRLSYEGEALMRSGALVYLVGAIVTLVAVGIIAFVAIRRR